MDGQNLVTPRCQTQICVVQDTVLGDLTIPTVHSKLIFHLPSLSIGQSGPALTLVS